MEKPAARLEATVNQAVHGKEIFIMPVEVQKVEFLGNYKECIEKEARHLKSEIEKNLMEIETISFSGCAGWPPIVKGNKVIIYVDAGSAGLKLKSRKGIYIELLNENGEVVGRYE